MFHFEVVADWIDTLLMSNMPQWLALAIEFVLIEHSSGRNLSLMYIAALKLLYILRYKRSENLIAFFTAES